MLPNRNSLRPLAVVGVVLALFIASIATGYQEGLPTDGLGTDPPPPTATASPEPHLGRWVLTGQMSANRANPSTTLLADGRVLVAGGYNSVPIVPLAPELYDPVTDSWVKGKALKVNVVAPTALRLADDKVMLLGGSPGGPVSNVTQIFDPASGDWTLKAPMLTARTAPAVLLTDGRVLVAGGCLAGAEIYNPNTNIWASAGYMSTPRGGNSLTRLPDGSVLVSGGSDCSGEPLASAEIYTPLSNSWHQASSMTSVRYDHTATLLPNGLVLVAGGGDASGTTTATSETYDPITDGWTPAGSMANARGQHDAAPLDGSVMVAGGYQLQNGQPYAVLSSAELFDKITRTWSTIASLIAPQYTNSLVALQTRRVLSLGGVADSIYSLPDPEIYTPWTPTPTNTPSPTETSTPTFTATPCPDIDCDGVLDANDNCPSIANTDQLNSDRNYIDNSPPYASVVDDKTRPNSDTAGDACDPDDDNDGIADTVELLAQPCPAASAPTDPARLDSDGDRFVDGVECAFGSDPMNAGSVPVFAVCGSASLDSDGDRLKDNVETCFYNTDPDNIDTDGDRLLGGATDGCEAASFNGDRVVSSGDQGMLASGISHAVAYHVNVDLNKDGSLSSGDQGLMASFISPPGQCPG